MKFYRKGDKSQAVCENCAKLVSTTFDYRTVPLQDGIGEVKDILAAVCDECGQVVATPPQSTPAIRRARALATKSIEATVPAPYLELLDYALQRVNARATAEHRKILIAYFAHKLAKQKNPKVLLNGLVTESKEFALTLGEVPHKRLSFKVTPESHQLITGLGKAADISNTAVLTGLIMQIDKDLVRPEKPKNKRLAEIEAVMASAYA